MSGYIFRSAIQSVCKRTEFFIRQLGIVRKHAYVGVFVRKAYAVFFKFPFQRIDAEKINRPADAFRGEKFRRSHTRRINIVAVAEQIETGKFFYIFVCGSGRIVCKIYYFSAALSDLIERDVHPADDFVAEIYGAVHIEQKIFYFLQSIS